MFCGSCMHDNTWAASLHEIGIETSLIPTYTPLRLDEADQSEHDVYLGGINVYLDSKSLLWRRLPGWSTRWLDSGKVLSWLSRISVSNDARQLGELTMSMLAGKTGPHRKANEQLVSHLVDGLKPDVIIFSNVLMVGLLEQLRDRFSGPILCMLQGDDLFLEDLPAVYRDAAIARIQQSAQHFDSFLSHSDYYRNFMSGYLQLPTEKFDRVPLGIDLSGHDGQSERPEKGDELAIGYFARICPEKGVQELLKAFRLLHKQQPQTRLKIGGYLNKRDEKFWKQLRREYADLRDFWEYVGSPSTHAGKVAFLKSLDLFSVPTTYHEPKGISVLEALANGVPVVQPNHGAFPELIEQTGGGRLFEPGNADALAEQLEHLLLNRKERIELGRTGQQSVALKFSKRVMAEVTRDLLQHHLTAK